MKVSTKSDEPQMRSASVPFTSATITVSKAGSSAEKERRDQELQFLALLVRVLNPQIRLKLVNEMLLTLLEPSAQPELFPDGKSAAAGK